MTFCNTWNLTPVDVRIALWLYKIFAEQRSRTEIIQPEQPRRREIIQLDLTQLCSVKSAGVKEKASLTESGNADVIGLTRGYADATINWITSNLQRETKMNK
jgi:hypothetical protein